MKEKLRQSLDDALGVQRMTQTYRAVIRQLLETHPETNDELTIVMIAAHNGMGKILVALYNAIEVIRERMEIHGDGEGLEKRLLADFKEDGKTDLNDDQMEEESEEYQDSDGDGEEYRDEWPLDGQD